MINLNPGDRLYSVFDKDVFVLRRNDDVDHPGFWMGEWMCDRDHLHHKRTIGIWAEDIDEDLNRGQMVKIKTDKHLLQLILKHSYD